MRIAIAARPRSGCEDCGDVADFWVAGGSTVCCVADGLGHGAAARQAAERAVRGVAGAWGKPIEEVFATADAVSQRTRGAAIGIAVIDPAAGTLLFAGVGNITALRVRPGHENVWLPSTRGIVGASHPPVAAKTVGYQAGDAVLLHSDGVRSKIDRICLISSRAAAIQALAERLLLDYADGNDDALILVAR